jgi:LPS export ABC transporter protein LptC
MALWQKRARFTAATVFLASAVFVYFAIGRRPPQTAPAEVKRIDPAASQESSGCRVIRWRGESRDFELTCETQLAYPDGTVRMINVTIRVNKENGRSYVVTAGEARSEQDQKHLQLSSGVKLKASDGFELLADRANYDKEKGLIHTDVPVSFSKGRMRGSGTAVDYNETSDVLTIGQQAKVLTVDEQGMPTLDFTAGTAVLDRLQDVLALDGGVHVLRDRQVMDADRAVAHLAPDEEFITFIELRGNSRVQGGGGALDAMSARDIDLDYTGDGTMLERVALNGNAGVTLSGTNGSSGRQLTGESLDVTLAADGTVTSAVGRENVRMVLPPAAGSPERAVKGRTMAAAGAPGQGLTSANFTDAVEYSEAATNTTQGRVGRARRLDLVLSGDVVSNATFTGDFTFEEPSFRAQSSEAKYDPTAGTLHLTGSDGRGLPCLADDQIAVDAEVIDVTVESRRLKADRRVKTTIRPAGATRTSGSSPCAVARQRAAAAASSQAAPRSESQTRLPGLLKQDQIATATADALEYGGTGKSFVYTGKASLFQGDTSLRGDAIRIDQERGDLIVTGNGTARTGEGRETVLGTAEEIRYSDERRMIQYLNAPSSAGKPSAVKLVQVNGPQGDLSAVSIDMVLNKEDGRAERLEAYQQVTAKIGTKRATADRLTYLAATDQYDMVGAGPVPVRVVDGCRETSGKALTYYKAENRTVGRGEEILRTQSTNATCSSSPVSVR